MVQNNTNIHNSLININQIYELLGFNSGLITIYSTKKYNNKNKSVIYVNNKCQFVTQVFGSMLFQPPRTRELLARGWI